MKPKIVLAKYLDWAVLAVLAAAMAFAPGAGASTPKSVLVFSGGKGFASIYQTDSTGKGLKRLLIGTPSPFAKRYASPSLSRNGKLLAYTLGYNLYVLNRSTGHKTGPLSNAAWLARLSPDGKKVDIPSYQLRPDDVISLRPGSKAAEVVRESTDLTSSVAPWLLADHDNLTGKILRFPERVDIDAPVQEQLIVELYSK